MPFALNSTRIVTAEVVKRQKEERAVVSAVVRSALKDGFLVSVDNGEEVVVKRSSNYKEIMAAMFSVDDEFLRFSKDGFSAGFVYLVYGNSGPEVVNDYSMNLERTMAKANEVADRLCR